MLQCNQQEPPGTQLPNNAGQGGQMNRARVCKTRMRNAIEVIAAQKLLRSCPGTTQHPLFEELALRWEAYQVVFRDDTPRWVPRLSVL